MRIASRINKLEKTCYPAPQKCPACGDIDFETGEGQFFHGILLEQPDGTTYCMCKVCGASFRARLTTCEDGGVWVTEAVPAEMPV